MNNKTARRGFTLVEIMIVVVIIGLLAAMAIPAFAKVIQQSRLKAVTTNLRQLANAAQQYMLNNGVTQAAYTDLVGTTTDNLINAMNVISGENYTGIVILQSQTQVTISAASVGTVTYNF